MKLFTKNTFRNLALAVLGAAALSACGGAGSCASCAVTPAGDVTLSLTAPNQYPAGIAVTAYLTMTNTSQYNATNLYYDVPSATNYTGTTITVANGVNNPCVNIAAGASCTFPAQIAVGSHPGSFTVTATPNGSASQSTVKKIWSSLKTDIGLQAATLSLTANIGLTAVPVNTNSGANGITFLYSSTIAASESGDTLLSVVGVVNSATAGAFNTINLTNASGTKLNFSVLSGNSGNGLTNLANGSVVSFLLTIPAGATSYQFYAQTMENGVPVDQGTILNPITLGISTQGILVVQPTDFALSANASYESQVVTLSNIGNGSVTGLTIPTPSAPLEIVAGSNTCGTSLTPANTTGSSCHFIIKSSAPAGTFGQGNLTISSNNGSAIANYTYAGVDPIAGVSVTSGDNPTATFMSNTESSSFSSQFTLKNTGNVSESNFTFTVPEYFTLSAGTTGTPCSISNNVVTTVLANHNDSCTLTLTYTNATVTSSGTANLLVDYSYHGIAAPQSSIGLTYSTTQVVGVLQVTSPLPLPYTFNSIVANNVESQTQVFTIMNTGSGTASNITNGGLQGPVASIFTVVDSNPPNEQCGSGKSSLAPGATCLMTVRFGPTAQQTGLQTKTLNVNYLQYPAATPTSTLGIPMQGTLIAPLAANPSISSITLSPAASGGNGIEESTPFAIESSTTLTAFTLTYKNTGDYTASGFTVDSSALTGYSVTTNGCNNVTLSINGTCNVVLSLLPNTVGNNNLLLSNLGMSWKDQRSPNTPITGVPSSWSNGQGTAYVNVYAQPSVTAVMSSESDGTPTITSVKIESDFYIVYTLSGGYNVGNSTYTATAPAGFSPVSGNCVVSSNTPSCYVKITAPSTDSTGNTITVSGDPMPSPTSFNLDVTPLGPVPYAYIAATDSSSNSYIYRCVVGANAMPSNCQRQDNSFAGAGKVYQDVRFREFGASKYLYAVFNGGMRKFNLDSAGIITSYNDTTGFSSTAQYQYLNFGLVNGWTVAFVTAKNDGYDRPIIAVCYSNDDPNNFTGNPSGMSGDACKPSFLTPTSLSPTGIAYINANGAASSPNFYIYVNYAGSGNAAKGKRYVFSTTGNDKVNTDTNYVDSNLNSSYPLLFDHYAQNAYSGGNNTISTATQCKVNETTWVFDNCTNNPTLDSADPTNYAKMAGRVVLSSGSNYVYYSMKTGNTLYVCPINGDNGTYSTNCTPTTAAIWGEDVINTVYGIDFAAY
ncbi:MAG: hypothetical protein K2Y14_10570 [Burkholderiales bacterium]|nr:hypothetical protein [Burkholderiales bacterium]